MAVQPATMTSAIPASAVGNAFVNQYYNVLHQSPHVVHRFYTDASRLSRAGPNGIIDTAAGQTSIHDKVMSLDYGDIGAEIKTIDSQESLSGSVLVMVTGALLSQSRMKRNFVQTFFLAPQERGGYFVLNDVCRYLDEDLQTMQPTIVTPPGGGLTEQPATVPSVSSDDQHEPVDHGEHVTEEHTLAGDHFDLPEQVEVLEIQDVVVEVPSATLEVAVPIQPEPAFPPVEEVVGEAPKKSYASILRFAKDSSSSAATFQATQVKPSTGHVERLTSPSVQVNQTASSSAGATFTSDHSDESQCVDEGDGCSIYVKNLSASITTIELEEEFGKFGHIKPGGVNLRSPKPGVCFAFIEFEEASSAQSAIEASPVFVGGRQAYVEGKRPVASRAAGRGRFPQGRGYLNEGFRGRGSFSGRGSARGSAQDADRDYNRGRASGTGRGGYGGGNSYASNNSVPTMSSNFNGNRRSDDQGGSGPRPPRWGVGNQAGRNIPVVRSGATTAVA